MCGRIILSSPPAVLAEVFQLGETPDLEPRFNLAPGQPIAAVVGRPDAPGRLLRLFHWGLIPPWNPQPDAGPELINARGETITEKPAFAEAFRRRRCLIPADGFYEWRKQGPRGSQPFAFRRRDSSLFALAGIWEPWEYPGRRALQTCAVITTAANALMRPIHHRMPVILPPDRWDLWLGADEAGAEACRHLLKPAPPEGWVAYPVTAQVGKPDFDGPRCLEPVRDDGPDQLDLFGNAPSLPGKKGDRP